MEEYSKYFNKDLGINILHERNKRAKHIATK